MVLLPQHGSGKTACLLVEADNHVLSDFCDFFFNFISHEAAHDSRLPAGQNDRINIIVPNRHPQRLHNGMDIFSQSLGKIHGIPLVQLEGFQQTQGTDMHIMLVAQSPLLPHGKADAAGGDIHKKKIVSHASADSLVVFLELVLQAEMLEINFLRHIYYLHIEARIYPHQVNNGAAVFRFSEHRRGIHGIHLDLVIHKKLLQSLQHTAQFLNGGERKALLVKYLFAKRSILAHRFNDPDILYAGVLHNAHGYIG